MKAYFVIMLATLALTNIKAKAADAGSELVFDAGFKIDKEKSGNKIIPKTKILCQGPLSSNAVTEIKLVTITNRGYDTVSADINDDQWSAIIGGFELNERVILKVVTYKRLSKDEVYGIKTNITNAFSKTLTSLVENGISGTEANFKLYIKAELDSNLPLYYSNYKMSDNKDFRSYLINRIDLVPIDKIIQYINKIGELKSFKVRLQNAKTKVDSLFFNAKIVSAEKTCNDMIKELTTAELLNIYTINSVINADVSTTITVSGLEQYSTYSLGYLVVPRLERSLPYFICSIYWKKSDYEMFKHGMENLNITAGISLSQANNIKSNAYLLGVGYKFNKHFLIHTGCSFYTSESGKLCGALAAGLSLDFRSVGDFFNIFSSATATLNK